MTPFLCLTQEDLAVLMSMIDQVEHRHGKRIEAFLAVVQNRRRAHPAPSSGDPEPIVAGGDNSGSNAPITRGG